MSRAEDLAEKAYPKREYVIYGPLPCEEPSVIDDNKPYRIGFVEGYHQAEKDLIAKACEYLDLHCNEVKTEDNGIAGWIDNEFITNFRKAMKDEDTD